MLADIIYTVLGGSLLVIIGELVRRQLNLSNEYSRKLLHIVHGMMVVAWCFLLPDSFIIGFELFFFVAMFGFRWVGTKWPQLGWVYQVKRQSYGEFFYPLGVIFSLLLAPNDWIFVAAITQLAVTDSVAALIGKTLGRRTEYKVFGTTKSVVGTTAFITTAILIFFITVLPIYNLSVAHALVLFTGLSLILAAVENVGMWGSDNLLLPVATAALLSAIL